MSDFIKICGTNIPANKAVVYALRYINGIGTALAKDVCKKNNINITKRIKDLSQEEIDNVRRYIESNFVVEGDLQREVSKNIKRLIVIKCYRGQRHKSGLPVRGQRTKTNARTRKGKRKNK